MYTEAFKEIYLKLAISSSKLVIGIICLVALLILNIKEKYFPKNFFITCVILVAFGVSYLATTFIVLRYEQVNELYDTYCGEFEISSETYVSLLNAHGYKVVLSEDENRSVAGGGSVHPERYLIKKPGKYDGRVIYTKYSKWVIYMDGIPVE